MMINAISFDVEDGRSIYSRDRLHRQIELTDTVVKDTERVLGFLEQKSVNATFFVLGDVAKKFPGLTRKIADANHEIGVHGFSHKQIFNLTREEFRYEISEAKKIVEDIISVEVKGHRAPAFSVMPDTSWALEVLAEEGFIYDSSVVPAYNSRYGWPDFSKDICKVKLPSGAEIIEVPMTTVNMPIIGKGFLTGGGYIRHFPYLVTKLIVAKIQKYRPVVVYMHPYEFGTQLYHLQMDHLSKKDRKSALRRLRFATRNQKSMPFKLCRLLSDFKFTSIKSILDTGIYKSNVVDLGLK